MCTANASPSIPATARSRPASPCTASAAIPMGCRWCGSRPSADLWCSLRTLRTITPICINAARFRSSTISATWPQDGRSSSGSPVIPIVSSPGTTRSLRRSTPAPATRSTPLPCTKCHRAHSRNSRRAALRSIARPQGRSASASRTRCSPRPRSSTELDPQQSRRARLAILRGKPDRCVRRAEARIIFALNDLEEESVVEHPRIGLKKFAAVVAIVEDVVVTQGFGHAGREVVFGFEIVVIVVRDVQEHRTLLAYARKITQRQAGSIRLFLVGLTAGLHQVEALLHLAEQRCQIFPFLRGKAGHDLLLPAQQAGDQVLVERAPLARHPQPKFPPVVFIFDAFDDLALHQRGHRAADGGLVRAGTVGDKLCAASIVAEAEGRQHPPFWYVEPVALLIFVRQRAAHLGRQPVQPERNETEQVQPWISFEYGIIAQGGDGRGPRACAAVACKGFGQKSLQCGLRRP